MNPTTALIRDSVRLVAPFFDDFLLKLRVNGNEKKVALDWQQKEATSLSRRGISRRHTPLHLFSDRTSSNPTLHRPS